MNLHGNGLDVRTRDRQGVYKPVSSTRDSGIRNGSNGYDLHIDDSVRTSTNSLLQSIGTEHLIRLRPYLKRVNLTKDQYLYQQDDKVDNIYFPETSVVSEFQILEDGRMIEVGIIGGEGAVGIASAFYACRAANCMQVCVAGTALVIGRDLFEREVLADPRLQITLHSYINTQIKQLSQRVVCNTFHSVEQRFCSWLLTLQGRSRRDRFRITHEHVARVLGVHRPSVTCIAQSLREKHFIDYGRARLVISDRVGIESLACGCGAELRGLKASH
jgi:CRP-like cAMP-binding protein